MMDLFLNLWNEEVGFVVSAELILITTLTTLAMVVGMAEVAYGINQDLQDTGSAFGTLNQSYRYSSLPGQTANSSGNLSQDFSDFGGAAGNIAGNQATSAGQIIH